MKAYIINEETTRSLLNRCYTSKKRELSYMIRGSHSGGCEEFSVPGDRTRKEQSSLRMQAHVYVT
jgi:hypothetical protein